MQIAAGPLRLVQRDQRAIAGHSGKQIGIFGVGTIAQVDGIGFAECGAFLNPGLKSGIDEVRDFQTDLPFCIA